MEASIRNAVITDSESLAELSHQLGYQTTTTAIETRLKKMLESEDHCVYVALQNKKIVGWIHGFYALRVESDAFVEIGGLVVNEYFRNNGIGKTLVNTVIQWSLSKKCETIRVRCNVIRIESHRFYETIGFCINKEQKIFNKQLK